VVGWMGREGRVCGEGGGGRVHEAQPVRWAPRPRWRSSPSAYREGGKRVKTLIHWCYTVAVKVLELCKNGVGIVVQWCYTVVTLLLQRRYNGVSSTRGRVPLSPPPPAGVCRTADPAPAPAPVPAPAPPSPRGRGRGTSCAAGESMLFGCC
jgi:hypothetical protein